MNEPAETTLTGNKLWVVVGILAFVAVLIMIGIFNPDARTYIETAIKSLLNTVSAVNALR